MRNIATIKENDRKALKDDYEHMQNMIFGDKPDFEVILKGIEQLGREINTQKTNSNGGI